jgi:tetratricopeptide (TPR) repeat protein
MKASRGIRFITLGIALALSIPTMTRVGINNAVAFQTRARWQIETPTSITECHRWSDESEIIKNVSVALQVWPSDQRLWLNTGRLLWLDGQCKQASVAWERAANLAPADVMARLFRSLSLYASHLADTWDSQLNTQEGAHYGLAVGMYFEKNRNVDQAIEWYERSTVVLPLRQTTDRLVELYTVLNKSDAAVSVLSRFAAVTPNNKLDYWWATGRIAEIRENWSVALESYKHGLVLESDSAARFVLNNQAGYVSQRIGRYAEAKEFFLAAQVVNRTSVYSYINLGLLAVEQGQFEDALQVCQQGEAINSQSELPDLCQGLAWWGQGKKEQALRAWQIAENKNPQNTRVKYQLALAQHDAGQFTEALSNLQQAIALQPGDSVYWQQTLGRWYVETGQCSEAQKVFQEILRRQPGDVQTEQAMENAKRTCP